MLIRHATERDIDALTALEALCFPPEEAASRECIAERVRAYGRHFWLLTENQRLISFVNGLCTDVPDLTDEMFADASMHSEYGAWQMIFGVDTHPEMRGRGYAGRLMRAAIEDARGDGRQGLVLTCKERLLSWYASFGFVSEGRSASIHGGAVWYQMRLKL